MKPFRSVIFLSAIAVSLLSACRVEGKGTPKEPNDVVVPSSTDNNRELDIADTLDRRDTAKYPMIHGRP
ncbi:MAG: hypothetical protein IPN44_07440 [Flavobacteriales bacterium]|nr:hypothetical protein [Flavobacteriales bacterium]